MLMISAAVLAYDVALLRSQAVHAPLPQVSPIMMQLGRGHDRGNPPIDEDRRNRSPGLSRNFFDTDIADFKRPFGMGAGAVPEAPPAATHQAGTHAPPAAGMGSPARRRFGMGASAAHEAPPAASVAESGEQHAGRVHDAEVRDAGYMTRLEAGLEAALLEASTREEAARKEAAEASVREAAARREAAEARTREESLSKRLVAFEARAASTSSGPLGEVALAQLLSRAPALHEMRFEAPVPFGLDAAQTLAASFAVLDNPPRLIADVPVAKHDSLRAADAVLIATTLLSYLPPLSEHRHRLAEAVASATWVHGTLHVLLDGAAAPQSLAEVAGAVHLMQPELPPPTHLKLAGYPTGELKAVGISAKECL